MQQLQGLHVLILGLGASGLAMARWCARHGGVVTVADTREAPPQLAALREQVPNARFVSGEFSAALLDGVQAVFRSPGLSPADVAAVWQPAHDGTSWCAMRRSRIVRRLPATSGMLVSTSAGGGGTGWQRIASITKAPRFVGLVPVGWAW